MVRYLFIFGAVSIAAVAFSDFVSDRAVAPDSRNAAIDMPVSDGEPAVHSAALSGMERLRADARGHHVAEFELNNLRVQGLIDTGATTVALNESTARRAGIRLSPADFVYPVQTANGTVMGARAVIDKVRVGSVRVRQVEALVLEDRALNTVLIGMSFLNRLRSFSYENGTLVLKR
ncbi:MAG: TIGR02281 family clan AA aspartic protease [Roseitalea sp.]|jgi:aspartyl protease family protein|uniref:retropepsin-like aspartic protease family protein n=1 Tax=Oceaniradius stylonematis TaxID=2184161 RepID=UPI001B182110|nr:TIGR02281 family clan AA aspartic protease [Oceaniradius stylonematis]MBO6553889.1 TIGR02281 family clan AA aspartic protease [Roseitalea sp.]MBO6952987.1 TIGR02281 family clan AA aspartic protease [Rhizobiaceae bacterium]MBO6593334.1 TIGR02281 family clan AA aspartic protease [Roseitalea sp.]MBO6600676.1 TIGR02281 family clan AA aspartic protease [Roseitalea sp.]MBO6612357.1 TIGR02281 family clan AA aspartic protease [Roseitalea sp.]